MYPHMFVLPHVVQCVSTTKPVPPGVCAPCGYTPQKRQQMHFTRVGSVAPHLRSACARINTRHRQNRPVFRSDDDHQHTHTLNRRHSQTARKRERARERVGRLADRLVLLCGDIDLIEGERIWRLDRTRPLRTVRK